MWKVIVQSLRFRRMPCKAANTDYYAVKAGRRTGVVTSWAECESLVKGFSNAKFKKFKTLEEAERFVGGTAVPAAPPLTLMDRMFAKSSKKRQASAISEDDKSENLNGDSIKRVCRKPVGERNLAVVYTDGACSSNGKVGARAGIGVFWGDGDPRNVSEPLLGKSTNNRAEIHAAVRAIRQAKKEGLKKVEIRTDSKFLIKSATQWIPGWQQKNWKTASGKPVTNKDDFIDLLDAKKGIKIVWTHVPGHAGIHGNEQADSLAVSGIKKSCKTEGSDDD